MKVQKLNRKLAHQVLYLSRFDFTLKHISSAKIEKIDELSKRLDQKVEIENDNNNQTLIKEQWIHSLAEVVIERLKVDIIVKCYKRMSNRLKKRKVYIQKIKNNKVGNKKLLVARSDKRFKKICK